jgi:predicted O-methyltransferase YrrM
MSKIRNLIFRTKILRLLIPFIKLTIILKFNSTNLKRSLIWLTKNSEFTNFLYDLTSLNRNQMIGAISSITNKSISEVEQYFLEIVNNLDLKNKLEIRSSQLLRRKELPIPIPLGRREVWYVLIRIYKPLVIVETGTEKGLGSLVIQSAIDKNKQGKLYTLDIDPYSGSLLNPEDLQNIRLLIGDSIQNINTINDIDFFIHDSDHSAEHERNEIKAASTKLTSNAIVISDNSHVTDVLFQWSREEGRKFLFLKETPLDHWYAGGGVGISFRSGGGGI